MRPHSATAHPRLWLTAAAVFLAACGIGLCRSRAAEEVIAGVVVTSLFAFFSLKKTYRTDMSALAALITLGTAAVGFLAALGASALEDNDAFFVVVDLLAALLAALPVILDLRQLKRRNITLALEGKRRRVNPIYLTFCVLLLVGGVGLLVARSPFAGTWMTIVGFARGMMEVFS